MDVQEVKQEEWVDLFQETGDVKLNVAKFNGETGDANILDGKKPEEPVVVEAKKDDSNVDANILDAEKDKKEEPKPLQELSGYFEEGIKAGKFVGIKEEVDGKEVDFIPKTKEEIDEFIQIQADYRLEQKVKEVDEKWYQSKSPGWQAIARYAEGSQDLNEVLPFMQSVQKFVTVKDIDENNVEGAEKIMRVRMEQTGENEDIIDANIEALKTTDKLIETAKRVKPMVLKQEAQRLANFEQQKQKREEEYEQMVLGIRDEAIKAIESPIYGKQTLKQEEKAAVYGLIAIPSEETKGYPIYRAIDDLFMKKDFDTLKQIALLLTQKEAYLNYISEGAAHKTAENAQRKFRVATDSRTSPGNDSTEERTIVQRGQYSKPRFGRG